MRGDAGFDGGAAVTPAITHFCRPCRAPSAHAQGRYLACGYECGPAPETSFTDRLRGSLVHPPADRRMLAVNALAGRGERQAVPRLRELAADDRRFLAAVAFRPVVAIESREARQLLLAARAGPAPVARVGRQLFDETDG